MQELFDSLMEIYKKINDTCSDLNLDCLECPFVDNKDYGCNMVYIKVSLGLAKKENME